MKFKQFEIVFKEESKNILQELFDNLVQSMLVRPQAIFMF